MDPIPIVGLQLVVLFVLTVPLGLVLLRIGERLVGRKFGLTVPERVLVAFYTVGCVFLVIGWIPLPLYAFPSIFGALAVGILAYAFLSIPDRGQGLRNAVRFVAGAPAWALGALTVGLLVIELYGVQSFLVGNTLDGSSQSLWLNVLLRNHTLALTLAPYSGAGVEYPQGATVWMSLPVVLFGWQTVRAPLYVPSLFLALAVPASYCLGERWARLAPRLPSALVGLVFAAAFALMVSFRGMLVGGTFDYSLSLPLFLVVLGWLPLLSQRFLGSWKDLWALSIFIGVVLSIGPMLGGYLLLFLGAFGLLYAVRSSGQALRWLVRWLASVAVSSLFLLRSMLTVALWYNYPDHALSDAGSPPYFTTSPPGVLSLANVDGGGSPFHRVKAGHWPVRGIRTEHQNLHAAAVILLVIGYLWPRHGEHDGPLGGLAFPVVGGTLIALVETVGLLVLYSVPRVGATVASLTYLQESCQTLAFFYTLIALLPIVAAVAWLVARRSEGDERTVPPGPDVSPSPRSHGPRRPTLRAARILVLGAVVVITVPLASGVLSAGVTGPGYISGHMGELANVTQGDLDALEWAGAHLPACSRVLVAPATVGMYLPEFAEVHLLFPGYPAPTNLSYNRIVSQLVQGTYTNTTREMMLWLEVTEVFVSGESSVGFPPFQLEPLEASGDFSVLHTSGAVTILEFLAGPSASTCPAR